jgi:Family of unknown function (DUF5995)
MIPPAGPDPVIQTVAEVIARMQELSAAMPAGDGVRAFNEMYLVTTRQVDAAIGGAKFADPAFMARLDVVFANLYLHAIELHEADPTRSPRSWGALFAARSHPGISQLQFAVAGMNAHINFDLARALVRTAQESGGALDAGRRADFQAVNQVLALTQPMVRHELLTGPFASLDDALGGHDDRVSMWGIEAAREFAWSTAQTLWAVRGTAVEGPFTEGLDRMVELTSRLILQGTK